MKDVIKDVREHRELWTQSLCFLTFSSSYRSITNRPVPTNVIFLPRTYQMPLPPCVLTTPSPKINIEPMEEEAKL